MQSFFAGVKINVLIIGIVSYCVKLRFSKNLAVFHVDMDHLERKASSSRGIRRSYDASYKLAVVRYAKTTTNREAGRKFGLDESNVRRWVASEEKWKKTVSTRKTFRGPKCGKYPELEARVLSYVQDKRKDGMPISREIIQLKAMEIAKELNIPRREFRGSIGWCRRFMRRSGLALRRRTTLAQRLPADFEEKLINFQRYVIQMRQRHLYPFHQIGNADETPVFFDMPSNTTVDTKGVKSVLLRGTGNEKNRITVMLAVTADGGKLPPYVILKRKTIPKESFPEGVVIRCQEKGWMTTELMVDWLSTVWNRRPGALLAKRAMLVLDAFKGHLTPEVKNKLALQNTDLVVIPGGMTSKLQVLDVVVNKPFKDNIRKLYSDWLLNKDHPLTPSGKIKKPSVTLLCEWILASWSTISSESIINGFKKCCVSNALDGTEDDLLWEENTGREENTGSESESDEVNTESDDSE